MSGSNEFALAGRTVTGATVAVYHGMVTTFEGNGPARTYRLGEFEREIQWAEGYPIVGDPDWAIREARNTATESAVSS